MQKVNFEQEMLNKLYECDAWLVGKDEAVKAFEEAELRYNEAKEAVAEYTEENVSQIEAYRNELEAKLVALGIILPKVEVAVDDKVDDVVDNVVDDKVDDVAEVEQSVEPIDGVQAFINSITDPNM